jgi:tetratricopeptide (TPR) repeat protein
MRRLFYHLLLIAGISLQGVLRASIPDELNSANQSLSAGHPAEALTAYQSVLSSPDFSNVSAPEIWYNRGLAEEKSGDSLAASLSYRRALLLDPTLTPARTHLTSVLTLLGISETTPWSGPLFIRFHPDLLVLGGAVLGWLGALALVVLVFSGRYRKNKRPGLIGLALAALIFGHALSLLGAWADPRRLAGDQAIVSGKGEQTLRDTPADSAQAEGTLAPGSLITILSRNGAWWKISSGPKTGWIPSTAITTLLPPAAGS